jgi:hypothetical protein
VRIAPTASPIAASWAPPRARLLCSAGLFDIERSFVFSLACPTGLERVTYGLHWRRTYGFHPLLQLRLHGYISHPPIPAIAAYALEIKGNLAARKVRWRPETRI